MTGNALSYLLEEPVDSAHGSGLFNCLEVSQSDRVWKWRMAQAQEALRAGV
jgi:hypothetical protein